MAYIFDLHECIFTGLALIQQIRVNSSAEDEDDDDDADGDKKSHYKKTCFTDDDIEKKYVPHSGS